MLSSTARPTASLPAGSGATFAQQLIKAVGRDQDVTRPEVEEAIHKFFSATDLRFPGSDVEASAALFLSRLRRVNRGILSQTKATELFENLLNGGLSSK